MQAITKELVMSVPIGTVFHYRHPDLKEAGKCQRWRKSGQVKTWKTRPDEWKMPIKHGLYSNAYMTQDIELGEWHLERECEKEERMASNG